MTTIIYTGPKGTAFNGEIIISREFYNPNTRAYLQIEAHEMEQEGQFTVAIWCIEGNCGSSEFDGNLRHVVKCIQEYVPDPGFIEMTIPEDAFQ